MLSLMRKFFNWRVITLASTLTILVAIPLTILLVREQQDVRKRAQTPHQEYKIGAYYFGMFDSTNTGSVLNGVQITYHRNDMWGGVKDFYGLEPGISKNPDASRLWPNDDFSYLKPQIGYYDYHLNGPQILSQQISQAKAAGLSYFNFYWYWDDTNHKEYLNSGLDSFLQASNKNDLEFMITVVASADRDLHNGVDEVYLSIYPYDRLTTATTIVDKYFKQPNYLKTSSGRPIIYILAHQGINCRNDDPDPDIRCKGNLTDLNNYITLLKETAQSSGVPEPFVLVNVGLGGVNANGYSCLNTGIIATPGTQKSYQEYINNIPSEFGNSDTVMPCFASNFDEKPRLDIGVGQQDLRYFTGYSDQKLREGLIKVKQYMDSHSSEISKMLTIYAWNEWHEGGIIEPNIRDGNERLRIISDVFNLIPPPIGTLDNISCSTIQGWACDPNNPSMRSRVDFYKDGPYGAGGTFLGSATADQAREQAVADQCAGDNNHGFSFTTPDSLMDGNAHPIYAYQITTDSSNPLLNGSPKSLNCTPTPTSTLAPTPTFLPPTATPPVTLTPTHTPTPTPTPTVTPTPTSTPNPTATPTPITSPTPTPSGSQASLTFAVKFQGIGGQKADKTVRVIFKQGDQEIVQFATVPLTSDATGKYTGTTATTIPPGTYDVYIKDPAHLQKKFASITLAQGTNTRDFSQTNLLAGDFNNDNAITIADVGSLLQQFTQLSVPVTDQNRIFDVNSDDAISIADIAIVLGNYTALSVPGD